MRWTWTVLFESEEEADVDRQVEAAHACFPSLVSAVLIPEADPNPSSSTPEEEE